MSETLVIGYGNPLRQDDGLGWQAARELARRSGNGLQVLTCHQLTPELAEPISRAQRVVFIDASQTRAPGSIAAQPVTAKPDFDFLLDHEMSPALILTYAKKLYDATPEAMVFSIGGQAFGLGEGLSPKVRAALPRLLSRVRQWILHSEREVRCHA